MGIDCAERVARIFTLLLDHPDFAGLFSDIHAAMEALRKLESTAVPTEWGDFDRIAIDEIQDLTAIEFALISSFHTQISTNQGRLVWLLLAGDEGQTVVPTDFSWGAMKSQLHASLNCLLSDVLIEEFKLESNLRCPHKITEVINRSAGLYRKFPRAARPANQTPGVEGQALQAQLLRIACSREEACYAVGCLAEEGRLIGDPNLPNGVIDENLRSEVWMRILSLGAHMMLNLQSDEVTEAVASAVGESIGGSKMTGLQVLFDALKEWAVGRAG